jgi:MFS transporter, ACS family, D-galactonate transporter
MAGLDEWLPLVVSGKHRNRLIDRAGLSFSFDTVGAAPMASTTLKPSRFHWFALFLLTVSVGINYLDRGNLSVALSHIQRDVHLDQHQLGLLGAAFFATYSLFQIAAGKLIDRFNVNWVYAVGYLLWSGATALMGLTRDVNLFGFALNSFAVLFILRLMLGIGESVAYPSYSKILSGCFPEGLRGTANAAIDAGSKIGPALGVLLGVKLVQWLDWRGMFVAIGAISLCWLLPWCFVAPRLKLRQETSPIPAPTYKEIATKRAFWGTVLGLFGANYTWYLLLTWLPYYFEKERHYSQSTLAVFSSLPFFAVAAASMLAGILADALIRRGRVATRVRQATISLGLVGCCVFMLPGVMIRDESTALTLLIISCICLGGFSSNHWALAQTLAGPEAAGKWTGLQNSFGNLAGVAAPWVTGSILNATHSFPLAFAVSCGALVISVVGYWFVIGHTRRVHWSTEEAFARTMPVTEPTAH